MDIGELASSLTTALVPVLPYLVKAGEGAAQEAGKNVTNRSLEWAQSLWTKLKPRVDAKPAALEAVVEAAEDPDDGDVQATLRRQLKKLLVEDQSLAQEVNQWLQQGEAAGHIASASGKGSVSIGGNVTGSTIITGDRNKVTR